jgi:nicotinamide mononucleotide (NMN) deamidase PncC
VTGGQVACHLSAAEGADEWFRGAHVAYSEFEVVLGV